MIFKILEFWTIANEIKVSKFPVFLVNEVVLIDLKLLFLYFII